MSSPSQQRTTQKHENLVTGPLGDKPVTALPGIGDTAGGQLADKGYTKASQVVGEYLARDKNEASFKKFLSDNCNANNGNQEKCYKAVNEWTQSHT